MAPRTGYRFHPTDEELVSHYLKLKMLGYDHDFSISKIPVVNVCSLEPWELPSQSLIHSELVKQNIIESEDLVWLFFAPPNYKYSNSKRANRKTNAGYWKITGKDRKVRSRTRNEEIAKKKTLVFFEGRFPNGIRTEWVMHEYHPSFSFSNQRDFVLCKLKKKDDNTPNTEEGDNDAPAAMSSTNAAEYPTEEDYQFQSQLNSFRGSDQRVTALIRLTIRTAKVPTGILVPIIKLLLEIAYSIDSRSNSLCLRPVL